MFGMAVHASFDFLGYTFRGRLAQGPRGYFTGFNPAISGKAKKAKGQQIRDWHLNQRSGADLSGLADQINPQVRGSPAGSTITEPSTAPSCASSHGGSTSISPGGPCRSSSDSAASTPKRWPGCRRFISISRTCSPTGSLSRSPQAGLWGPDDGRLSPPVLRAAGGEIPRRLTRLRHLGDCQLRSAERADQCCGLCKASRHPFLPMSGCPPSKPLPAFGLCSQPVTLPPNICVVRTLSETDTVPHPYARCILLHDGDCTATVSNIYGRNDGSVPVGVLVGYRPS